MSIRLHGDFNGLFGDLLCLSHSDVATDESGATIALEAGMEAIAFEEDIEDGQRCFLVAKGHVVRFSGVASAQRIEMVPANRPAGSSACAIDGRRLIDGAERARYG